MTEEELKELLETKTCKDCFWFHRMLEYGTCLAIDEVMTRYEDDEICSEFIDKEK